MRALASGQAAQTLAILTPAGAGDHIVSATSLYGATYNLLRHTLPRFGIEVPFVDDPDDIDAWAAAIRPNTKAPFAQALGNPRGNVLDIRAVADAAHAAGLPLVVDNTSTGLGGAGADRSGTLGRPCGGAQSPSFSGARPA